jgi:hypothetical protein
MINRNFLSATIPLFATIICHHLSVAAQSLRGLNSNDDDGDVSIGREVRDIPRLQFANFHPSREAMKRGNGRPGREGARLLVLFLVH